MKNLIINPIQKTYESLAIRLDAGPTFQNKKPGAVIATGLKVWQELCYEQIDKDREGDDYLSVLRDKS